MRGRPLEGKTLGAAVVESRGERAGALRLAVLPAASQAELGPFVRGAIDQGEATVRTDGMSGYGDLRRHGTERRGVVQGDPARAAELLPGSHLVFANLEGWPRGTFHGVGREHLPRSFQEFVHRTNRPAREHDLFFHVLRRAVQVELFPWARLTAESKAWAERCKGSTWTPAKNHPDRSRTLAPRFPSPIAAFAAGPMRFADGYATPSLRAARPAARAPPRRRSRSRPSMTAMAASASARR